MHLLKPLTPSLPDGILRVDIPGRISTLQQDEKSNDSQHEEATAWLKSQYTSLVNITCYGDRASGWLADRDSMVGIGNRVKAGLIDVVLATELREIYRNPAFHWKFAQDCVDHDVRLILIHDLVDTANEDWETAMHVASLRHGMTVPETRRRVRRKATSSFGQGGMVMKVKYGYRKLSKEEAGSGCFGTAGLRVAKIPEATHVIMEMRARVLREESAISIAEWLRAEGIDPGPYVISREWSDRVLLDLLRDTILSGRRQFRLTKSRLVYSTGKHRSEPNMDGPERKEYLIPILIQK